MKIDPITLRFMLESMAEGIREMNELIGGSVTYETIHALARIAHKLKGEASVVGFAGLSQLITDLEDSLSRLSQEKSIHQPHIELIAIDLKKIVQACQSVRKKAISAQEDQKSRLAYARSLQAKRSLFADKGCIVNVLELIAKNVSESCGKKVALKLEKFNYAEIPQNMQLKIQDMAIQLVKNAITHGLETPEEREALGKSPVGEVALVAERRKNAFVFIVSDNGQGINLEHVRKSLIGNGHSVMKVAKLSDKVLLSSLFHAGFSTHGQVDQNAGRGVGLDLVKDYAKNLGGKVQLRYEENKYTHFIVQIPLPASAKSIPVLAEANENEVATNMVVHLNEVVRLKKPVKQAAMKESRLESLSELKSEPQAKQQFSAKVSDKPQTKSQPVLHKMVTSNNVTAMKTKKADKTPKPAAKSKAAKRIPDNVIPVKKITRMTKSLTTKSLHKAKNVAKANPLSKVARIAKSRKVASNLNKKKSKAVGNVKRPMLDVSEIRFL